MNACDGLTDITDCESFADGVRIGAAFVFDLFAPKESELKDLYKC